MNNLSENEETFRTYLDQAAVGICHLSVDGKFKRINKKFEELFGYSQEEIQQLSFQDVTYPEDIDRSIRGWNELFADNAGEFVIEKRYVRKDRSIFWANLTSKLVRDQNGQPLCINAMIQDITIAKDAATRLEYAQMSFKQLFENMNEGVALFESNKNRQEIANYTLIDINSQFEKIFAINRENVIGKSISDTINIHELQFINTFSKVALQGQPETFEMESLKLKKWFSVSVAPWGNNRFSGIFTDITDRINTQKALAQSERRLNRAQQIARVGNWELDLSNFKMWASEEAFRIYGLNYDSKYIELPIVQNLVLVEDRPKLDRALKQLLEEQIDYNVEFRIRTADINYIKTIHSVAVLELDHNGNPLKVLGVIRDITEQKKAEEMKRESELKFRSTFDYSPVAAVIVGIDMRFIECNQAFASLLNYSRDEIIGKNVRDITHPDDVEIGKIELKSILAGQIKTARFQKRYLSKEQNIVWGDISISLVKDQQGEPLYFLPVIQDITEIKKAEQVIAENEEKFRHLFESAGVGIGYYKVDGTIISFNRAATDIVGRANEDMTGQSIWDVFNQKIADIFLGRIKDAAQTDESMQFEDFVSLPNGAKWFLNTFDRIGDKNQITIGVQVISQNITDRKNRELEILYISRHDGLTQLYNRSFFEEEIKRLNHESNFPLSLIMGDINGLKLTNDVFGHAVGDELLKTTARIMLDCIRPSDIIARVGGDEFNIILPNTNSHDAKGICDRINQSCDKVSLQVNNGRLTPSISLGFATKTSEDQTIDKLLKSAEDMMYKKKLLEQKSMHSSLVTSIKATMYEKSQETKEHADRITDLACKIGRHLLLTQDQLYELELLSTLHDIGKIGIDEYILAKPGALTDDEWIQIKKHPEVGYRIALASPELFSIADGILCHHERWDGKGYPQGLSKLKIPLLARIITVADAYDAMTNHRVYRSAFSPEQAIAEIVNNAGKQFDPTLVDVFLEVNQK